jgi:hypothetical protein
VSYAPINSPVLTGDPRAPTPAVGDNDTSIATTGWVKLQGYVLKSGDTMTGALVINQNAAALPALPALAAGQGLWIGGTDSQIASLGVDAFGGFPVQYFRAAKGTAAARTALTSTDLIMVLQCHGAQNSTTYGQAAQITCKSRDNWTTAAHGAYWYIETCPPGSVTLETAVTIGRGLMVGGSIANDPGPGGIYVAGPATFGGTVTSNGNITIAPSSGWANLTVRAPAAGNRAQLNGYVGTNQRWELDLGDGAAESTGNAGSNFGLARFNDAGTFIDFPLTINRATGNTTFSGNVTVDGGNIVLGAAGGLGIMYLGGASPNAGRIAANNTTITLQLPPGAGASSIIYSNPGIALHVVDNSGNLTIAGGTATKPGGGPWVAPSDFQLKVRDSIEPYKRGLDAIMQLQPVIYEYNGEGGLPKNTKFHGLIADDVEPVLPEAVGHAVLGARPAMAEDDESIDGKEYRTLDQNPVFFAMLNAIKELKAELDELKAATVPAGTSP